MSFSSRAKDELVRLPVKNNSCTVSELAAVIHLNGIIGLSGKDNLKLKITTESAAIARRILKLIKNNYMIDTQIVVRENQRLNKKHSYELVILDEKGIKSILEDTGIIKDDENGHIEIKPEIDRNLIRNKSCKRAYLRGAFLATGSVSDPEKTYHLEIVTHTDAFSQSLCNLINSFELNAKIVTRKGNYVVYLKEGEHIVDFLNLIGAHTALLNLENVRIYKDMRNNVNRIVNCETANLSKTVNAACRQIHNIEFIRDHIGLNRLPPSLRQIAELRLDYSESSLKELGSMLSPPIGKSGVNHRLRKLDQIAENYRNKKGVF